MQKSAHRVYRKSDQGLEELRTRRFRLNPRLRQLLILVDGRRDNDELLRMLPSGETAAQLAQLEADGFIEAADAAQPLVAGGANPHSAGAAAAHTAVDARQRAGFAAAVGAASFADRGGASTASVQGGETGRKLSGEPGAELSGELSIELSGRSRGEPGTDPSADLSGIRRRVTRALIDVIGPNGDALAIRAERAGSVDELRALLPAVLSVIEAVAGRRGVDQFLQRCGPL